MLSINVDDIDPKDMPLGAKVWYYVRHSPGDNQTLDSQISAIRRLITEKQWNLTREFKDEGLSGKSTHNRKAFELMTHLARQKPRQADMLIIWEFSRFARDQLDSQLYRAELRRNGWKLLSMKDDIPKGPITPFFEALIDWKNEQFLIDLRANTKRGLYFIAEQGCVPMGPIAKGYTYPADQMETEVMRILQQHVLSTSYLSDLLAWTNEVLSEGLTELQLRVEATQRELTEAHQMALKMARNFALMERPTRSAEILLHEQDEQVMQLQTLLTGLEYELANSRIETTLAKIEEYVQRTEILLQRAELFDLREICG